MKKLKYVMMAAVIACAQPAVAATVLIERGQLIGATDLLAGQSLVDVSFVDGTCAEVFDGCDGMADFPQLDDGLARSVLEAIRDDVILGGPRPSFDNNALLTRGCERGARNLDFGCLFSLPLVRTDTVGPDFVPGAALRNLSAGASGIDLQISFGSLTKSNAPQATWVVVSNIRIDPTVVPLPATLPLAVLGVLGLGLFRRSKRA